MKSGLFNDRWSAVEKCLRFGLPAASIYSLGGVFLERANGGLSFSIVMKSEN